MPHSASFLLLVSEPVFIKELHAENKAVGHYSYYKSGATNIYIGY